ncbi:MAG: efflux RND transporter periplasmic adaptor subunit [Planctomycetaceae bacterium]|nr:efflux RND transporter periplasmic adaptor subunit [Planctomycetota bacterium]NUN51199.1 efflux RND transporter periplasmic adaptor subunit [Planctomycetaceae bacterium]
MSEDTRTLGSSVVRLGSTVLVFGALGAVGLWGHRNGWKAPKFSEAMGKAPVVEEKEDWCEAHNVPDSKCIACHPELAGGNAKDWCKEHGVPESKCTACHPEILEKGKADDWCKEHGLPESQCTLCHPEIAVKGEVPKDPAAPAVVAEPGAPGAKEPFTCQTHHLRVQFASAEAVRKAGVALGPVEERPMAARLVANGETDYDQTRVARVSVKAAGTVARVFKEVGQEVRRGEVVALVDAEEVGKAKAEFLSALAQADVKARVLERIQASAKEGLRPKADLQEAEAEAREARISVFNAQQRLVNLGLPVRAEDVSGLADDALTERMRLLGLPTEVAKSLGDRAATANLLPVTAPLDGVVIEKETVPGEVVEAARTLFVVADVSRMWVQLDVRQEDASLVATGQAVSFHPDGARDGAFKGKVTWIATAADERTRTVRVRAEVENPDRAIRARTFGTGRITVREAPKAVVVPDEAVQWEGCCHVVFVRLSDEIFQTRKVRVGVRSGGFTEVLGGVLPGEVVATAGSAVLKADILKSKLGAGCVDD